MLRIWQLALLGIGLFSCRAPEAMDIVVIGGGLMGSATAWQLSQQGQQVLLLEQQDSAYTFGSSFGESRITRSLGPPEDIWSYLHNRSVRETEKLIAFLNQAGSQDHSMEEIYSTSPVSYLRHAKQRDWIDGVLKEQTDPYQFADNPQQAHDKFGVALPDSAYMIRELKTYSGTLNPKVLIGKLHLGIIRYGNSIWYRHRVDQLIKKQDHYQLTLTDLATSESKIIRSKQIITAAGPYTGTLLKSLAPYFDELITPKRLFLAFLKIPDQEFQKLTEVEKQRIAEGYPVINTTAGPQEESFYAMIEGRGDNQNPIIKIGGHYLRKDITDLDGVWALPLDPDEIQWSSHKIRGYLEMLNLDIDSLEYIRGYSCVYSLTRSEVPYVTGIRKDSPDLVVVAGMSGVGAKGSLTYGLLAADLLSGQTDPDPMYQKVREALGYSRLQNDLAELP